MHKIKPKGYYGILNYDNFSSFPLFDLVVYICSLSHVVIKFLVLSESRGVNLQGSTE